MTQTFILPSGKEISKITAKQYSTFSSRYWREDGYGSNVRFGQAFMNEFYPEEVLPELFYEENAKKAEMLITSNLVDWSS